MIFFEKMECLSVLGGRKAFSSSTMAMQIFNKAFSVERLPAGRDESVA